MNEKFSKNAKVDKFTSRLGIAVRLIVIDPLDNKRKVCFKLSLETDIFWWSINHFEYKACIL